MSGISFETRDTAIRFAKPLAAELNKPYYVIELQRGWTVYSSTDPKFSDHQPATYVIVQPGS